MTQFDFPCVESQVTGGWKTCTARAIFKFKNTFLIARSLETELTIVFISLLFRSKLLLLLQISVDVSHFDHVGRNKYGCESVDASV